MTDFRDRILHRLDEQDINNQIVTFDQGTKIHIAEKFNEKVLRKVEGWMCDGDGTEIAPSLFGWVFGVSAAFALGKAIDFAWNKANS